MLVLSPIELPNDEHVKHREPNTLAYLRNTQLGEGTLCISADRLIWSSDNGQGFILAYPQISLHAISRDLSNFHSECLYLMLEDDQIDETGHSESEALDESSELNELRFVPRDLSKLDAMYRALCECQLLHPDPQDSLSEEEEEEEDLEGEEDDDHPPLHEGENGGDAAEDMEVADGQFDDAHN